MNVFSPGDTVKARILQRLDFKVNVDGTHQEFLSGQRPSLGSLSVRLMLVLDGTWLHVVATTKKSFQPDIETDEKISAAHLVDFELGFAGFAVTPGHRDRCPGVTADDRFEGNFYRQIEMGRNQWSATIDGSFPISFKRVRCVVEFNIKDQLQKPVREAV